MISSVRCDYIVENYKAVITKNYSTFKCYDYYSDSVSGLDCPSYHYLRYNWSDFIPRNLKVASYKDDLLNGKQKYICKYIYIYMTYVHMTCVCVYTCVYTYTCVYIYK